MTGIRLTVDYFFPGMTTIGEVQKAHPELFKEIKLAQASTSLINSGKTNEEKSTTAKWHICYHDEPVPKPCGKEIEL
jgi:hypothetical protein